MTTLRVTDDSTRDELAEAIGHLRARHASVEDQQVRDELAEAIDELLDMWGRARA